MSSIEVNKDGIKISYLRFLADASSGFILLLALGVAWAYELPVFGCFIGSPDIPATSPVLSYFPAALALFLCPSIGLTFGFASWFLLGWFQVWAVEWSVFAPCSLPGAAREFMGLHDLYERYGMSRSNWLRRRNELQREHGKIARAANAALDHVFGGVVFARNLSLLLAFLGSAFCLHPWNPTGFTIFMLSALIALLVCCVGSVHHFGLYLNAFPENAQHDG